MTTDAQLTAWLDQEDAHLARVIREHRWAVQFVGPGEEPDEPAFGYTIGLFGLGHPEVVVAGVGAADAHRLLNGVASLVAGGRDLVPGEFVPQEGWAAPVYVEVCPNPGEVVLGANRFYQRPADFSVPAYQLAWPDPDGRYPWESADARQPRPGTWRA